MTRFLSSRLRAIAIAVVAVTLVAVPAGAAIRTAVRDKRAVKRQVVPTKPPRAPTASDKPPASSAGPQRIRLSVHPRRLKAGGRKRRLRFRVTTGGRGLFRGAQVKFRGSKRTNIYGEAKFKVRLRKAGRYRATATAPGTTGASATVLVRRKRKR